MLGFKGQDNFANVTQHGDDELETMIVSYLEQWQKEEQLLSQHSGADLDDDEHQQAEPPQPESSHPSDTTRRAVVARTTSPYGRLMRYAIFLRGVNVGGIKVPSADLKALLADLGLDDVKTYVASGNVTCESRLTSSAELKSTVEKALSTTFSYDAKVLVFAHDELAAIVAGYPFDEDSDHHRYAVLCDSAATANQLAAATVGDMEKVSADGRTLYWRCPKGSTLDTPFSKFSAAKRFRELTTTRNLNTVEKML